jgi:hypothetical protein
VYKCLAGVVICLLLATTSAYASCVEIERATAIMAAASARSRTDTANIRGPSSSGPIKQEFIAALTATIEATARQKGAVDQAIALLRQAINRDCASPTSSIGKVLIEYRDLSRLLGSDIRKFRRIRTEVQRTKPGTPAAARISGELCEHARATRAQAGRQPLSC